MYLRSKAHNKRLSFRDFEELALKNWIRDARFDVLSKVYDETGKYKLPKKLARAVWHCIIMEGRK